MKIRNYRSGQSSRSVSLRETEVNAVAQKPNTAAVVRALAEPVAASLGLQLWDVRFQKEGRNHYLRIIIDKPGGVTMDDCVDMSHAMDPILDEKDPIDVEYNLQVSSPGVERELVRDEHFLQFVGARVMLRTREAHEDRRSFKGVLTAYADGEMTVETDEGPVLRLGKKDVSYVKLDDFRGFGDIEE